MAKSQQTYSKKEKEKKRRKKREEKQKKKEARKAAAKERGNTIEFAYVGHDGQLTDTPPDPNLKVEVDVESIEINIPRMEDSDIEPVDPVRKGKVSFYDSSKGFGFIIDAENQEKYFTHVSGLIDEIAENDKVSFELEKGLKGMNAVKVTLIK
ncbi:MAG: cold shock domain-containing protein [Bacteroidia bacterium]|nr:cold shock domain-containing protein [Bacteroidia bacterium]NNF29950.1 cold shock domain-containing protein [Flavobacteriaceae bacterium]MBT8276070.1 cold shock domain-containing protein [Bacteroidia bacterium]NNJ81355.1 cold shock domain-containing protein [Flavobacteriaceae bacterium]NNK53655.1 cold shock domain-containing protein [Flavobacteriaceae bacterium]